VLDIAGGCPAVGMNVRLEYIAFAGTEEIARAATDSGGRITSLGPDQIEPGTYRLIFDTGGYLGRPSGSTGSRSDKAAFFPEVTVTFTVADGDEHYHVPLLMSPFGYSTYRGS
jgi:5-hydroxyisourate hydrolase